MANQADQISQLAGILVRMHVDDGKATRLRLKSRLDPSHIGKLCGTTAEAVRAWERGTLAPTTTQALTWLSALYGHAAAAGADLAKASAAVAARPFTLSSADPETDPDTDDE